MGIVKNYNAHLLFTFYSFSIASTASFTYLSPTSSAAHETESGQLNNCCAHMKKRGSRCLRYALFMQSDLLADYLAKKRFEGKHYNVVILHAAKKLVRLIFALKKSSQPYIANS